VLIIYLLAKHLGGPKLENEDWFDCPPVPCFFRFTPRFLAFISFYLASMGNDYLESRERCLSRPYIKKDSGYFCFSKGSRSSSTEFLVLSEVLTHFLLLYIT
jgi:hypothetical protein